MTKIVVIGDVAVKVPEGASCWDVARWVNPGILPDEFREFDLLDVSPSEISKMEEL